MSVPESNAAIAMSYRNAKCKKIQTSRTPSVGNQEITITTNTEYAHLLHHVMKPVEHFR